MIQFIGLIAVFAVGFGAGYAVKHFGVKKVITKLKAEADELRQKIKS